MSVLNNIFAENGAFYPTPKILADKMAAMVKLPKETWDINVLEPSAGKGDLIQAFYRRWKSKRYSDSKWEDSRFHFDVCEIDPILRNHLKGISDSDSDEMPEIHVVGDDFLQFDSWMAYNVILMNPPFADGDRHLLHAMELVERSSCGGQIICVLNAETLRNPYTNSRKALAAKLTEVGAEIQYMTDVFISADRPTAVEIALVSMVYSADAGESHIWEDCVNEEQYSAPETSVEELAPMDFFENLCARFRIEVKAGLKLIREYQAMKPFILDSIDGSYASPMIKMDTTENAYIQAVRYKYWKYLFTTGQFTSRLTVDLQRKLNNSVADMKEYDFTLYNIQALANSLMQELTAGIDDTIMGLFDELSGKYSYYSGSDNIWYYNGWKSNKAHKVNTKVILPASCCVEDVYDYSGSSNWSLTRKKTGTKFVFRKIALWLDEIERVFDYLDMGETQPVYNQAVLEKAAEDGIMRNIQCKYFTVTFYKKGTCHVNFTGHERILRKLNIYAAKNRSWLPPTYGMKHYADMTGEEQAVVDEFQGCTEYEETLADSGYYLTAPSDTMSSSLLLGA